MKRESGLATPTSTDGDKASETKSFTAPSTPQAESINCVTEPRISNSLISESTPSTDHLLDVVPDKEVLDNHFSGKETPLMEMAKLNEEIKMKNQKMTSLEKQMVTSFPVPQKRNQNETDDSMEVSQSFVELVAQLNEKSFELEVKTADNRVIQEQLNQKIHECEGLQATVASLKQQLSTELDLRNSNQVMGHSQCYPGKTGFQVELSMDKRHMVSTNTSDKSLLHAQTSEVKDLKQKVVELTEAKEQLEARNQKLAEESSYAKGLASAAAVELKALSEEVAKLMNQNERLNADLAALKYSPQRRSSGGGRNARRDGYSRRQDQGSHTADIKRELAMSQERELSYEAALMEREQKEAELQKKVEESKQREAYLENELANMWVLVAKLKKSSRMDDDNSLVRRDS